EDDRGEAGQQGGHRAGLPQPLAARLDLLQRRVVDPGAAQDRDHDHGVALDRFTMEAFRTWMPTARRRWTLGHLDPVLVTADRERLGLAVDGLLEDAGRDSAEVRGGVGERGGETGGRVVGAGGEGTLPAELDRIFGRFRSGSQLGGTRGTGLGLALVRAVARAHGGAVRVRSAPGEGSEFTLMLPVRPPPRPGAAVPGAEPPGPPDAGRAVPSDALAAGSRPACASGDPGPPGAGRTIVEEV